MLSCWVVKRTEHFAEQHRTFRLTFVQHGMINNHPLHTHELNKLRFSDWLNALPDNTQHLKKQGSVESLNICSNFTEQDIARVNKAQQGGQTL